MQPVAFARRAAAFILAGALAACGGGGGSHSALPGTTGTGGTTPITPSSALTQTLKPTPKFASSATKAGAVSESTLLMHVVVNLRDAAGLADYAAGASTPGDPRYRQFLTASQIGDRFGATQSDTATVAQYLASYGLHVAAYPQRLGLTVSGATTNFAKAFGTTFATYTMNNGHPVTAPVGTITFAKPLPVEGISDAIFDPAAKHTQFVQGAVGGPQSNSTGGNSPQQIATAFDYTGAYNAGYTGAGVTIGIIGTGGIDQHDFATFKSLYSWPSTGTLTQVNVTSAAAANTYTGAVNYGGSPTASPPPVTAPCRGGSAPRPTPTCNPEDLEAQIDTEQASLAPGANINFYLAYVPSECYDPTTNSCGPPNPNTGTGYTYQGLYESDDEIQQAIADNNGATGASGHAGADVLSLSYGGPEILNNVYVANLATGNYDPQAFGVTEFAALAAEGVAVFVSSGDQGAETCAPYTISMENNLCVSYPSGDVSVTSVGGVTAPINNAGQFIGPMTAWGTQTNSGGASGGGVSNIVPAPSWEKGPGASAAGRNQPDVSLDGDPYSGVAVIGNSSFAGYTHSFTYGGTSVAAPEMAAMWALVLQACAKTPSCVKPGPNGPSYRLGNAAPYFWNIYNSKAYGTTMYDVTFGSNALPGCSFNGSCASTPQPTPTGYAAGTGYDNVTGIGVPFARHLIQAVVGV